MSEDLNPFMFEVPRAFGMFDRLLKEIGATEAPLAGDYADFLLLLKDECGENPLNPNEIAAVVKVIHLLDKQDTRHGLRLFIPDEHGCLVEASTTFYRDNAGALVCIRGLSSWFVWCVYRYAGGYVCVVSGMKGKERERKENTGNPTKV